MKCFLFDRTPRTLANMRDSVPPHRFRLPNRHRLSFPSSPFCAASLALACALAGCSGKTKGQVILALQTDMSMPEDVTKVKIEVKADGVSRFDNIFIIDPNQATAEQIPATLSVVAGEKESETIELKIVALRDLPGGGDEPRTLSKTVTTIPKERIAMLRVPMQWLCTDQDGDFITDLGDGEYESACDPVGGKEASCVAGGCKDVHIDSSHLPDFAADAVFGGSDEPGSGGKCFPTEQCFNLGEEDLVPDADCVVTYDPPSDEILNFAILAVNGGICSGSHCYVGLDKNRDFGWFELEEGETSGGADSPQRAPLGRRFQLPQGVCTRIADGRAVGVRVSTADECQVTKTAKYPTCGPWSSVGKDIDEPEPPTDDADGDGVDGEAAGGDDCDDDDNTVYPGALEACDGVDNDCNVLVDDNCVADLPFSHRVDFSALDGFTSNDSYAIYQVFDATRALDLDPSTLTFEPSADHTRYTVTSSTLDWDSDVGEIVPVTDGQDVSNCDDCFAALSLDFPFNFYGNEYTTVFPGSNGYLTFGVGDSTYTESVEEFLANAPRISAFWDDLDTRGEPGVIDDEVHYFSDDTKMVVTYQNIQIFPDSGTSNTFQFVLLADGTIKISYNGMQDLDESSIAGITPGSLGGGVDCSGSTPPQTACFGICVDLETNVDHCGACGNRCASEFCSGGECVGETNCQVSNAACPGVCVGSCQFTTPAPCDGTCSGTCDGTCTPDSGSTSCFGTCDGDCQGTCSMESGGDCADSCSGVCYIDAAMTCPDPAADAKGPCTFSSSSVSPTSCYDSASTADGASFSLSCSGSTCTCSRYGASGSVTTITASTPADACADATTLRSTFMDECVGARSACGAGCPAAEPDNAQACDETEINYCYYSATSTYCYCMGGEFLCQ
jgi:hypothetical protein